MCRNIRPLFNLDPPATESDVRAAAEQFVRKISGYTKPSRANQEAFGEAITNITRDSMSLIQQLQTSAPPRNRALETAKTKSRTDRRPGP